MCAGRNSRSPPGDETVSSRCALTLGRNTGSAPASSWIAGRASTSKPISAAPGSPAYRAVRGTSFAAPLVAALLAETMAGPDKARAAQAVAALAKQALRPDGSTVSNETGYGIVATAFRVDPASLR